MIVSLISTLISVERKLPTAIIDAKRIALYVRVTVADITYLVALAKKRFPSHFLTGSSYSFRQA